MVLLELSVTPPAHALATQVDMRLKPGCDGPVVDPPNMGGPLLEGPSFEATPKDVLSSEPANIFYKFVAIYMQICYLIYIAIIWQKGLCRWN